MFKKIFLGIGGVVMILLGNIFVGAVVYAIYAVFFGEKIDYNLVISSMEYAIKYCIVILCLFLAGNGLIILGGLSIITSAKNHISISTDKNPSP